MLIGNLHFSSVELSDTRTARPYVCIVQNSVLGKLVQGDDQIVVPRHSLGMTCVKLHVLYYSTVSVICSCKLWCEKVRQKLFYRGCVVVVVRKGKWFMFLEVMKK